MSENPEWLTHDPLRPASLAEFDGQPTLVRELGFVLSAARAATRLPDPLLFAGPPGLGKTTLAGVVAHELGLPIITTSGPAIERPGDLASLVASVREPSVLFIDEIHRLTRSSEELLYPVLEDGAIDLTIGEGTTARTLHVPLSPLVLIGATTQTGLISAPLRDRFGYVGRLRPYDDDALSRIVQRSARLMGLELTEAGARAVAERSRSTPRVANAHLRRVRDVASVEGVAEITDEVVVRALDIFGVDGLGLDGLGRDVLRAVCERFGGGPVGLTTLAAALNEAPVTVESYEPFLMARGLLMRTPRGRVATAAAFTHLGLTPPLDAPSGGLD